MSPRTLKTFLGITSGGPLKAYIDLASTDDAFGKVNDWLTSSQARSLARRLIKAADAADKLQIKSAKKINKYNIDRRKRMLAEDQAERELFEEHEDCCGQ